jgi:hypothetical protein
MNTPKSFELSLQYLSSSKALETIRIDAYWPKWNSPWWHMLLFHEMGETRRIPEPLIREFVATLNRMPLKIFPIFDEDVPAGINSSKDSCCHCQLGNVYQVLSVWGLDVDQELPWIRPWFLRYQMADGGLNCDNAAYRVEGECPSSMVGTIAAFESVLLHTPRGWTPAEKIFLDKASDFLIKRKLILGSPTVHNAEERDEAKDWVQPCFPRYYHYEALLMWREKTGGQISESAIQEAVRAIQTRFPDGQIRNERRSFEGEGTLAQTESGEWKRIPDASFFPLLEELSEVGKISPYLSQQWREILGKLDGLRSGVTAHLHK